MHSMTLGKESTRIVLILRVFKVLKRLDKVDTKKLYIGSFDVADMRRSITGFSSSDILIKMDTMDTYHNNQLQ